MNIVVENGSYFMDNLGDVAMLQVCVRRIRDRWPDARVMVISESPERLAEAVPDARALAPAHGHRIPMTSRTRHPAVVGLERRVQLRAPRVARWLRRRQIGADEAHAKRYDAFHDALEAADAVVCSGGGYLNDSHLGHTEKVLYTLATAQAFGRPTAMFGAGLGPLEHRTFRTLAGQVIGRVRLLALRERAGGLAELDAWKAAPPRLFVTGDDAVELVRGRGDGSDGREAERSPAGAGPNALGVSLRHSREYGLHEAAGLGSEIRQFCRDRSAPLRGLPVRTRLSAANDIDALRALLGADAPDLQQAAAVETPAQLIAGVRRCRVVLTGTYHAGVFALSAGVPIVTLSGSAYYDRKFAGLAEQFGSDAVRRHRYDEPELPARVGRSLEGLWREASALEGPLRDAAARQVERGHEAYRGFFRVLESGGDARDSHGGDGIS